MTPLTHYPPGTTPEHVTNAARLLDVEVRQQPDGSWQVRDPALRYWWQVGRTNAEAVTGLWDMFRQCA